MQPPKSNLAVMFALDPKWECHADGLTIYWQTRVGPFLLIVFPEYSGWTWQVQAVERRVLFVHVKNYATADEAKQVAILNTRQLWANGEADRSPQLEGPQPDHPDAPT